MPIPPIYPMVSELDTLSFMGWALSPFENPIATLSPLMEELA